MIPGMYIYIRPQESLVTETAFDDEGAEGITSRTQGSESSLELEVNLRGVEYRLIMVL